MKSGPGLRHSLRRKTGPNESNRTVKTVFRCEGLAKTSCGRVRELFLQSLHSDRLYVGVFCFDGTLFSGSSEHQQKRSFCGSESQTKTFQNQSQPGFRAAWVLLASETGATSIPIRPDPPGSARIRPEASCIPGGSARCLGASGSAWMARSSPWRMRQGMGLGLPRLVDDRVREQTRNCGALRSKLLPCA